MWCPIHIATPTNEAVLKLLVKSQKQSIQNVRCGIILLEQLYITVQFTMNTMTKSSPELSQKSQISLSVHCHGVTGFVLKKERTDDPGRDIAAQTVHFEECRGF